MIQRTSVMVVNCGSSSVKLDVFSFPSEDNPFSATVDRVGRAGTRLVVRRGGESPNQETTESVHAPDQAAAVRLVLSAAQAAGHVPHVVGHRVVHGGAHFSQTVRVDDGVVAAIRACIPLAPLHNPANLAGIETALAVLPGVPHVAAFDTAFHQTLPPEAYLYALPRALYEQEGIRRYGFHGTSHRYVAERAAAFFMRPLSTLRLVTLHLGNGCSACAVDGGKSVETSMGMTPLEGLMMGTRSGDVDPAVVLRLARARGVDAAEELLLKESGLLGVSKTSPDMRDLEQAAALGNVDADLAIRMFALRVRKVVGAYAASMGGIDAVVFTGGIGENSKRMRKLICSGLSVIGALLDDRKNESAQNGERDLASMDSRARILVLPTDEERAIARDAMALIG